jgi:HSP20 family molecular chaperone IbpA
MYYTNSSVGKIFDDFFRIPELNRIPVQDKQKDPYDVYHTKDGAYCVFEVPGFNKTNLKVELEDGNLYIEGKRKYKINEQENEKVVSHKLRIGEEYDPSKVEATIEDGILTVFVQNYKKPEKKKRISLL